MKTDANKDQGTQPQPPSPELDASLNTLEQRGRDAAPIVKDAPAEPGTGTDVPGPDAAPAAEYVPKGPDRPGGFDKDRPWGIWVAAGDKIVQRLLNNWDFATPTEIEGQKLDGHSLYLWGTEKWLTNVMPNGFVDIEKYPLAVALIGLGLIALNNLDTVLDANGVERWRFRPMRKAVAKAGPTGDGAKAEVGGPNLTTRGEA